MSSVSNWLHTIKKNQPHTGRHRGHIQASRRRGTVMTVHVDASVPREWALRFIGHNVWARSKGIREGGVMEEDDFYKYGACCNRNGFCNGACLEQEDE